MLTMYCLVSRQAMANVLPVFMYNPSSVVLFTTPEENQCADNLEKLFKSKKISVKRKDNLDAYDYNSFKETVKQELEQSDTVVWLNVTGGTKLMALAAYEAFAEKDKKIIYCDTEHQKIITLFPKYYSEELKANLDIKDYLNSYGYEIVEHKNIINEDQFFELFSFVEQNNAMPSFLDLFKQLRNKFASETEFKQVKFTIATDNKLFQFQKNYDNYFIQYGNPKKKSIKIATSEFKSGDWLEYYVYYLLKKKKGLSPLVGVKLKNTEGVENEIDVIVLNNYRLNIFSCKSGKKDNQFDLYQLETLRNITSGTFGKGIFVTANKHSVKFLNRAKELSIKVFQISNKNDLDL